jgi:uncharacterized protein
MRFLVSQIREAQVVEQEESVSAQELIGTPPAFVTFRHPVNSKVQARMTRDGEIVFSGEVSTVITYQCGRCLEFFDKPVELDFQQVVTNPETEVDVTGEIRETLLVDLPVRAVCRENCKGICATCGKNRNNQACNCEESHQDPRWNQLKEFPFKQS